MWGNSKIECPFGLGLLSVCVLNFTFPFLFFFSALINSNHTVHAYEFTIQETKCTVHVLFIGPTTILLRKKIKNRSHGTIHTFKNYVITIFSVFNKINCIHDNGFDFFQWV